MSKKFEGLGDAMEDKLFSEPMPPIPALNLLADIIRLTGEEGLETYPDKDAIILSVANAEDSDLAVWATAHNQGGNPNLLEGLIEIGKRLRAECRKKLGLPEKLPKVQ